MNEAQVKEALGKVIDPALGHDIVTYRILRSVEVQGDDVLVRLDIPTAAYPQLQRRELAQRVEKACKDVGAKRVTVIPEVVTAFMPAPSDKAVLKGPKNVIAVAAGKGGVGKSTVATNMALALARHGAKVGLLDTDVFGPSIPTMLGAPEVPPQANEQQRITPAIHHGIKVISFWDTVIGENNELVYICAFDDLAHRTKAWAAFQADPEWLAARKASEANGPLVERVVNKIWKPTPFSPLQ